MDDINVEQSKMRYVCSLISLRQNLSLVCTIVEFICLILFFILQNVFIYLFCIIEFKHKYTILNRQKDVRGDATEGKA